MNKLTTILIFSALALPLSALAQPDDDRGPRERPDRDRAQQRDRSERPERPGADRFRPGDRDREGERGERPGKREPLTADQVDEAIATLRAMHGDAEPPWLARIEQLAKDDPEEAAKSLSRFPRIRDMMHARKNKPEEFELHTRQSLLMRELLPKVRELKMAQKDEDQAKVDELRPQVRERVEKLFAVRMQLKELEIKKIREKLKRAEDELAGIRGESDALIDEKMNEIMTSAGPRGPREDGDRPDRPERGEGPDRDRPRPDRDERE